MTAVPRAKSLAACLTMTCTAGAVAVGAVPAVLLVAEATGLAVIGGLSAVGKALWERARPEVVDFGADTACKLLAAVRRRLKIAARKPR